MANGPTARTEGEIAANGETERIIRKVLQGPPDILDRRDQGRVLCLRPSCDREVSSWERVEDHPSTVLVYRVVVPQVLRHFLL